MLRLATIKIWLPGLLLLGLLAFLLMLLAGSAAQTSSASSPSDLALSDIPADYLALYAQAGDEYKTDWWVLAAIGKVETDHGRSTLPGVHSGSNPYGAAGPMQFGIGGAAGNTWGAYGVDGNHDGKRDVYDPRDAIPAAANYTGANGAPKDWKRALWRYNHSSAYYQDVMSWADRYRPTSAIATPVGTVVPSALAHNPNIQFQHPCQVSDVLGGRLDPRLMAALDTIAHSRKIIVTALRCDHSTFAASGNVSNHSQGRAADIGAVDGERCDGSRYGKCGLLAYEFSHRRDPLMPTESIYCFDPDTTRADAWAQSDHCDHWHLGFNAN